MNDRAWAAMALAALLATATAACSGKDAAESRKTEPVQSVTGVGLESVRTVAIPEMLEVVGTVRARTSAVVSTRIPGTVSILRVREGDRVRKGQLLLQLDARENQASASLAVAGIEEAQRGRDEALARKKLADTTFERYQKLFNEQAVTRQEFDVKQTEKELAGQGVARAEARLKQAQEGSKAATTMADYTKIVAPITGIITSKQADLGATVFPAQPLMTLEDEGSYQLELAIPESMIAKVRPGAAVQVHLDALGIVFAARIAEIVPTADPASRTSTAKIALTQNGLRSGMFGRGAIALGSSTNGILVPKKSIVEHGALTSVCIVDSADIVRLRLVKTGKAIGDKVEILSGLSDGERLVVSGVEKVSEGVRVK